MDSDGNVLIADTSNHRVRKVTPDGVVTTVAGTGASGYSGDSGAATAAQLASPSAVAIDSTGALYISDMGNARIRKVVNGTITTVVGDGTAGFLGDGGPATSARISTPKGLAFDTSGNLYIADSGNNRIRKVTGTTITTFAGAGDPGYNGDDILPNDATLYGPTDVVVDSANYVYIADAGNYRIRMVHPNGGTIVTVAGNGEVGSAGNGGAAIYATLNNPVAIALDASGMLYIADTNNNRVRRVDKAGAIYLVAGGYTAAFEGDGGPATSARLNHPAGLAIDRDGNLVIADTSNSRIRRVDANGIINTIAGLGTSWQGGDGDLATQAQLYYPSTMTTDASGNLFIADTSNNRIRRVSTSGVITTVAGINVGGFNGEDKLATKAAIDGPAGVAFDRDGNMMIADQRNDRIRIVWTDDGTIHRLAGNGSRGDSGDAGAAVLAQISQPADVVGDANGNFYFADYGNHRIRKVTPDNVISTYAGTGIAGFSGDGGAATSAQLNAPQGVAIDAAGNLYVADTGNHRIRRISTSGSISTFAGNGTAGYTGDGGSATGAELNIPTRIAVDAAGAKVYIADSANHRVRLVTNGTITTFAGTGTAGDTGDGGAPGSAALNNPTGVYVDKWDNVYIADRSNHRIRMATTPVNVTFDSSPSGRQLTIAGVTRTTPFTLSSYPGVTMDVSTPDAGSGDGTRVRFAGWSDGNTSPTITVTKDSASYTALFTEQVQLTRLVSPAGAGTVIADPASADGFYANGTRIQLWAVAERGYVFAGWGADAPDGVVTLTGPATVNARFTCDYRLAPWDTTVSAAAGSGTFTVTTGAGCAIEPVASESWLTYTRDGATLTFQYTANPGPASRYARLQIGTAVFTVYQDQP